MSCPYGEEDIFQLVEGELDPGRRRALRAHLRGCAACRERYERELMLSDSLRSLGRSELRETPSIACQVAMALPTRSGRARIMWTLFGAVLFALAVVALELRDVSLITAGMEVLGFSWGVASGLAGMLRIFFTAAGSFILLALAVGALIDLGIAAGWILFRRRRAREA
ncbi:hypothetical protein E0L93_12675 [Rubrobacter taiwanensis]|jgi:anti-sigma factor RsiW|uniref:Putative zinc-finger domain-containing protein n=1 Tax=Rubrobacter taiwanensis TaxID=185139 RepID=A0A4R1BEY1_9ACTN|nr:zf-HC2 domain-containing protein [Rubrobacter taiwanensis]TCJ15663.1 hypothetical protein E0L93_12675 [Rubrobacter taiwanensis]